MEADRIILAIVEQPPLVAATIRGCYDTPLHVGTAPVVRHEFGFRGAAHRDRVDIGVV